MCILHKSEDYGKILLKQKDKQSDKQINNFAIKLSKQMPYPVDVVTRAISELLTEKVLVIEGDFLIQKRMVSDNILSLKRADAGSKGGKFAQAKIKANPKANTENEIVDETENGIKKTKSEIFKELFSDEIYLSDLSSAHRGKDLKQAFDECYTHHSNSPSPPEEIWEWRQKLNTWLTIKGESKNNNNGKSNKTNPSGTGSSKSFSGKYEESL